jgi:hypothetical protein
MKKTEAKKSRATVPLKRFQKPLEFTIFADFLP